MTVRTATVAENFPLSDRSGGVGEGSRLTHTETLYKVVDVGDNSTIVYSGPCMLFGVYVNTVLSNHALPIKDNTTTIVSIAASAAVGTNTTFPGIRFETSMIVDPDDSATGNITVAYRPL